MEERVNDIDPREQADPDNRNGYAPFPECIIVSSERSGLNLIRHIVESLTTFRTPGKKHIRDKGILAFHRTHFVYNKKISPGRTSIFDKQNNYQYKKMILLLRDPREIFVRAYAKNKNRFLAYCRNIEAYDAFTGEKELIYYDDIIQEDKTFQRIFKILNISNAFNLEKIPQLRAEAVNWYEKFQQKGGGSMTKGSSDKLNFHQQKLTNKELKELAQLLKNELGEKTKYFDYWNSHNWLEKNLDE